MSDVNKAIVKTTQKILTDMGVTVKTTQIYEMYAKLSGFKNWNVASASDADFSKVLQTSLYTLPENASDEEKLRPVREAEERMKALEKAPGTDPKFLKALETALLEEYGELPEPTITLSDKQKADFREFRIHILDSRTTPEIAFAMIQRTRDDGTLQYALMQDTFIREKMKPIIDNITDTTKVPRPSEIKLFHLDAENSQIDIHYTPRKNITLEYWQGLVGGYIQFGHTFPNGDVLVVNEDGLSNMKNHPDDLGYFSLGDKIFVGNAFVIGQGDHKSGGDDFVNAKTPLKELLKVVKFFDREEYQRRAEILDQEIKTGTAVARLVKGRR